MESYSGRIPVEDDEGSRFFVHEYRGRRRVLFPTRRYMLDTGEAVRRLDKNTFEIARTGERLIRVDEDEAPVT